MYCLYSQDPYETLSVDSAKEPVGISLLMVGKPHDYIWMLPDEIKTPMSQFRQFTVFFQKLVSRSFSGLFQLFVLISTEKGLEKMYAIRSHREKNLR